MSLVKVFVCALSGVRLKGNECVERGRRMLKEGLRQKERLGEVHERWRSEFEVKGLREGRRWREGQSAQGKGSPARALPHQAGMALCPSQSSAKSLCASCLILLGGDATQLVTSHKYTYKWCCRV